VAAGDHGQQIWFTSVLTAAPVDVWVFASAMVAAVRDLAGGHIPLLEGRVEAAIRADVRVQKMGAAIYEAA
jgi:hypothetical protein